MFVSFNLCCELLGISQPALSRKIKCGKVEAQQSPNPHGGRPVWQIDLSSLPQDAQDRYWAQQRAQQDATRQRVGRYRQAGKAAEAEAEVVAANEDYLNAPAWQKDTIDQRLYIVTETLGMSKAEAMAWCDQHGYNCSMATIYRWRKAYRDGGKNALASGYGNRHGSSSIPDDVYKIFVDTYMTQSQPSLSGAYMMARGYMSLHYPQVKVPSLATFSRRFNAETTESAIYHARYGASAWNRKYGFSIMLDHTTVKCGTVAVGDHMQFDAQVLNSEGKPCRPWLTAWIDWQSTKFLGWDVHIEDPNSDHIFASFHRMASTFGLPDNILIDNGKDYRCKDFAGGRKVTARVNEEQTSSLMSDLGIKPWFALPYNAQRKPIERTFRAFHNMFERMLSAGYTGTNSVKRPEVLKEQVKRGQLMTFAEFTAMVDSFITEIFNKREFTHTAIHAGKSPDEIWAADNPGLRRASAKTLAVFMQRTSKQLRIGRNGVRDTQLGVTYWAEEFGNQSLIGSYCYLRRDIKDFSKAWVYAVGDDRNPICLATAQTAVNPFADTDQSKAAFKEQMARKRRVEKAARKAAEPIGDAIDNATKMEYLKAAVKRAEEDRGAVAEVEARTIEVQFTPLDETARGQEQYLREATTNTPVLPIVNAPAPKRLLPLTPTQRDYQDKH